MTDREQPRILRDAAEVVRLALAGGDLPRPPDAGTRPPNPLRPTADPREQTPRSPAQLAARVAELEPQVDRLLKALDRMNAAREAEAARADALAAEVEAAEARAELERGRAIDLTASRDHWRDACTAARAERDALAGEVARLRRDARWQWAGLAAVVLLFVALLVIARGW